LLQSFNEVSKWKILKSFNAMVCGL
jgi:hypothetical protein